MDEDTRALLGAVNAAPGPRIEEMSVADSRAALEEFFLHAAPQALVVGDVVEGALGPHDNAVRYRLYRPRPGGRIEAPLGALLFLHGGGWSLGTLDSYDAMMRWLCARANVAVMSLAYRLAPEHKYPAQLDDAAAALAWLRVKARSFGLNPARIALGGDSSGGTLVAVVCQQDRGRGEPALAGQILLYPVMTLETDPPYPSRRLYGGGGYFLSERGLEVAAERYLSPGDDRHAPRVSPILESDLRGLPPTLVMTAGFDPLKDEGAAYAMKLRAARVPIEHRCFESTIHGFLSLAGVLAVGRKGLDLVSDWLSAWLTS